MPRGWRRRRVVLLVLIGLLPIEAGAVEHPLPARSLVLRTLKGGRGRLHWSIHSRALSVPAANPRLVGGSLRIVGADEDVVLALPAVGWTVSRSGTSLRFANPRAPAGTSPVRLVVLHGSKLTLQAKGAGIALNDRRQGTVSIALTIGDDVYCSRCSAPSVDARGRYRARVCPVPAGCPPQAPATTTTTTLTAELPTTSSTTTSQSTTTTTATTTTTLCALVTQWGSLGSGAGELDHPNGVAVSADGTRVYVADAGNDRVVTFDSDGGFLAAIGSRESAGSADGAFVSPADVAVTGDGNLLVLDGGNHRIQKLDANGAFLAKWGGLGSADGAFSDPMGFGIDARGNVYVADWGNNRVQVFDGDGRYLRQWGTAGPGVGQFELPLDVAVGSHDVFVTELEGARRLSRFTLLGEIPTGVVSRAVLPSPTQVAVDGHGHVYVANSGWVVRIDDPGLTGVAQTAWNSGGFVYGVATAPGNVVYATDILKNSVQKRSCPP